MVRIALGRSRDGSRRGRKRESVERMVRRRLRDGKEGVGCALGERRGGREIAGVRAGMGARMGRPVAWGGGSGRATELEGVDLEREREWMNSVATRQTTHAGLGGRLVGILGNGVHGKKKVKENE